MSIILNIGRRVDATGHVHPSDTVYAALAAAGLTLMSSVHVQSETEPTIVAEVESIDDAAIDPAQAEAIRLVSAYLLQDCIATWQPSSGQGALLGPRPWAAGFLPHHFVGLDGQPLAPAPVEVV